MTSEHIRQMRELRAEKNKLEAERDHWMNEAIELRRDLESLKQSETDLVNEFVNGMIEAASEVFDFVNTLDGEQKRVVRRSGNKILNKLKSYQIENGWTPDNIVGETLNHLSALDAGMARQARESSQK